MTDPYDVLTWLCDRAAECGDPYDEERKMLLAAVHLILHLQESVLDREFKHRVMGKKPKKPRAAKPKVPKYVNPVGRQKDGKVYHYARAIAVNGDVKALCYKRKTRVDLDNGQMWTFCKENVTCRKCRELLAISPKIRGCRWDPDGRPPPPSDKD